MVGAKGASKAARARPRLELDSIALRLLIARARRRSNEAKRRIRAEVDCAASPAVATVLPIVLQHGSLKSGGGRSSAPLSRRLPTEHAQKVGASGDGAPRDGCKRRRHPNRGMDRPPKKPHCVPSRL